MIKMKQQIDKRRIKINKDHRSEMKTKKHKFSQASQQMIKTEPFQARDSEILPKRRYGSMIQPQRQDKTQGGLVSLFVNLPVYEDYKHIDLNKTTIYQQRINHHKPKNLNQANWDTQQQNSQISTNESKSWKTQILKYMELKKKSCQKHYDEYDGYPLMRLSKKNERLRKIRTNQTFTGKPKVVAKLQTEELFDEKPLVSSKTNPLPKLARQTMKFMNANRKQLDNSSTVEDEGKRKYRFREVVSKASKNEKVLINFIGNYFRQKFCPERRYSHQIVKKQHKEEIIKIQIKNIFDATPYDSMRNSAHRID